MTNAKEIVKAIVEGNFTREELDSFYNAYRSASSLNRQRTTAIAMATLKAGMKGKLVNIRPKSYLGREVEIVAVKLKRLSVKELGGFGGTYTVAASCFEPLDKQV